MHDVVICILLDLLFKPLVVYFKDSKLFFA